MFDKKLFDIKYGDRKIKIDKIIDNSLENDILNMWKKIKRNTNMHKKSKIIKE